MWLMKTLLTSGCTNQRGAGHFQYLGRMVTVYPTYIIIDGIKISRSRLSFAFQLELAKAIRLHEEN
ncbi:hypothetical protein PI91_17615 [Enterobacter sp. FB]|nr:hypothetical protein PI91_17615 [Enterobacter sp. FB]